MARTRRRSDEQGAVTLSIAGIMVALLGIASFAVDLGMQRVGVRDMQALSDIVALDMARRLDGRTALQLSSDAEFNAAFTASVARNDDNLGDDPTVTYVLGLQNPQTGKFDPLANNSSIAPNAIKVTATSSVDYVLRTGEGAVSRFAIGAAREEACFKLGSFAAVVNSGNSPILNALINDALGASALSYQGLATSTIELGPLATQLGVGTPQEALDANVTVGTLLNAAARALTQQTGDPTAAVNASLLQTIAAHVAVTTQVQLGDILSVADGTASASEIGINVLDLVAGTAFVANGENFLSLPATTVTLPGLTNVVITLKVIEKERQACGPVDQASARSAQIQLRVTGKMVNVNLGVARATLDVDLSLDVAHATGTLRDALCGAGTAADPTGVDVEVASGLTDLELRLPTIIHTGGLIDVNLLKLDVVVGTQNLGGTEMAEVRIDSPDDRTRPVQTGAGSVGLSGLAVQTANVNVLSLGLNLGSVLGPLTSVVVNPLVAVLDSALLTPLTELLGINVSGADVFIGDKDPDCQHPALRG